MARSQKKIRGLVTGFEACKAARCRNQSLANFVCGHCLFLTQDALEVIEPDAKV